MHGKYFENGAFWQRWRHNNHVISLPECSTNTNPKWPMKRLRVKSFSNSPSEVWTGLKLRYVLILARRCYSAKNSSFDSPTSVPPGSKWANSWGAKRLIWQVLPHMVFSQIKEKMAVSWACACRLSSTLFSPAWVQLLYSAGRKYSSGTGLCSILCDSFTFLASYAFLLQIIPAFYK